MPVSWLTAEGQQSTWGPEVAGVPLIKACKKELEISYKLHFGIWI